MKIMIAMCALLSTSIHAQIKNAKTETVKIYGNCGMCESKIEKTGSIKKIANVDWNHDNQMATITYDATMTNQNEILKRIALAGYDSEKFLAPDDVYNNLHGCCQYDRVAKVHVKGESKINASNQDHSNHGNHSETATTVMQNRNQLKAVFDNYFLLKDTLVSTDGSASASASNLFLTAIANVNMENLDRNIHTVWMKVMDQIKENAGRIADTKDIKEQREYFTALSNEMYTLIAVAKYETPVYVQFCPMYNGGKGAYWLSKDNTISNPYYGAMMVSCGKTVETIK